jgi:tetratricopeptide (TPR) repeat protein
MANLLRQRIVALPDETRRALSVAAFHGKEFGAEELSPILDKQTTETLGDLLPALTAGMLVGISDGARDQEDRFAFAHDRIQQAAYSLMDKGERASIHKTIGERLLGDSESLDANLFDIADHLNRGSIHDSGQGEDRRLAELNLRAASQAKQAAAFEASLGYFLSGLKTSSDLEPPLIFELRLGVGDCFYLLGKFKEADLAFKEADESAETVLQQARLAQSRSANALQSGDFSGAIAACRGGLAMLNLTIPEDPITTVVAARTKEIIRRGTPNMCAAGPEVAKHRIRMSLLGVLWPASYQLKKRNLNAISVIEMIELSMSDGAVEESAFAFLCFALLLQNQNQNDLACEYADAGITMAEESGNPSLYARVSFLHASYFTLHQRISQAIADLSRGFEAGLTSGNLTYAGFCANTILAYRILAGHSRHSVTDSSSIFEEFCRRTQNEKTHETVRLATAWSESLKTGIRASQDQVVALAGSGYKVDMQRGMFCLFSLQVLVLEGDLNVNLLEAELEGSPILDPSAGFLTFLRFYSAYASLSRDKADPESELAKKTLAEMDKAHAISPANIDGKRHILNAELARIKGDIYLAGELYDQAVSVSRSEDNLCEEALALERAGRMYLGAGRTLVGGAYLSAAHQVYEEWGAHYISSNIAVQDNLSSS